MGGTEMTEEERQSKLVSLASRKQMAEKAYDGMYEAHSPHDANACYRDAKEHFYDAMTLARELGMMNELDALNQRLLHIKAVFRSQFA
jgi:hypothetical protein